MIDRVQSDSQTDACVQAVSALGTKVCATLTEEILKLGFTEGTLPVVDWQAADFTLKRDPFSGEDSIEGVWRDAGGERIGMILFHAGGRFFSEYDVVRLHPNNKRWFVEAVTAWGDGDTVKAEARLLPALSEV